MLKKRERENYKKNCKNFGAIKVKIKRSKIPKKFKKLKIPKIKQQGGEFKEIKDQMSKK